VSDDSKRATDELDRELIELLNELRVALPGVQVLFAFLLAVPFANGWRRVTHFQRDVFFVAFLCTAAATILLIAPSTYHRLRWREHDKEHMLTTANRLTIAGSAFLARNDRGRPPDHRSALLAVVGDPGDGARRRRLRLVLVRAGAAETRGARSAVTKTRNRPRGT
jgi:hypothetical protein